MTQKKHETKTLLQRMGFADPDLGDPLHTEIIHWIDTMLKSGRFEDLGLSTFRKMDGNHLVWHEWEYPIKSSNRSSTIAGFLDMAAGFKSHDSELIWSAGWEAKVSIPDLPILFRQLQVYRAFGCRTLIVVCIGDVCERDIQTILEQGYGFVKPCLDLPK